MKSKKFFFVAIIFIAALICSALCVYHYGMGVYPYYEERFKESDVKDEVIYWLEDGTIVEQLYRAEADYMVGLDLYLAGTGKGAEGTLYIQLCDAEGNLLSQKREQLEEIEPGKCYSIRFLEVVDVSGHENLIIRLFVGENNKAPGMIAALGDTGVQDNISCSVNGERVPDNLAISYLYGKWQYVGYRGQGKTVGDLEVLAASLFLIMTAAFFLVFFTFNRNRFQLGNVLIFFKKRENLKQILAVLWFFGIFLAASAVYKIPRGQHVPAGVYLYIAFVLGATGGFAYQNRKKEEGRIKRRDLTILHDKGLVLVVLLSTLVRIPLFLHIQAGDGTLYYGAIQNICKDFEYSLGYIWTNFRLYSHYAIAYTFINCIGEFLIPDRMTGVLILTLILMDAALVCIYKMFRGYWVNLSQKQAAIGTMLVSLCPLFLGLFSNVSLDILLPVFTIFLLYAEYKEQTIMKAVWMLTIVLTKETGIVIVGGYLFAHICVHFWETLKREKKDRLYCFLSDFHVACSIGGVILLCLFTIKQNGLFTWMGMSGKSGRSVLDGMAEKVSVFLTFFWRKFSLIFVIHFGWIPTCIIIICLLYRLIKKIKWTAFRGQTSFLGTLGAFVLANFILSNYVLARYHIFSAVMLWVLAFILLFKTFKNCLSNLGGVAISGTVMILMIVQTFFFIDPLTNMAFEQFDTGKGKMISTEMEGGNFSETFITNFRHTYLYGLFDAMLADSNFDADAFIIIAAAEDRMTFYDLTGYDKEEKRRVFCSLPDGEKVVPINRAYLKDIVDGSMEELPERGIIYFMPYIDYDEQEILKMAEPFYEAGERREVSNWGGTMAYYIMKRKSNTPPQAAGH
ncbi:hypothetical protein [Parablautia intestinalis]|uniref:hypothetical protein n=3 Tax=Parablautia intestinalis TaxID=2320100 RepID=UPI00256EFDDF|nr:hypothetical protein [Parablautia intestinalis]